MEKILLALDAQHINTQTIDFACYVARLTNSRLTGIFLEDLLSEGVPRFEAFQEMGKLEQVADAREMPMAIRNGMTEANIKSFRQSCECRGIPAHIHRDRGIPLDEVVEESRFADLLIVDVETSFAEKRGSIPHKFVKDVLQMAECPVMLAPYSFHPIDEIIFAYNGSSSSVFAIKQFTYLFPELKQKKAIVVDVKEKEDHAIEHQYKMKEWLQAHYADVELKLLTGDPSDQLFGYLLEKKNAIVVMGAYGRSLLSSFFKRSHAHLIVKTVNLPIFVTHH